MIYLAQTDTTAGFLSKDLKELNLLKNRAYDTPCLITTASFKELLSLTRVPSRFKNSVRKAKKTSFIYKNKKAIRVVKDCKHSEFLAKNGWFYSSSANLHGQKFDFALAKELLIKNKGILVDEELFEGKASSIFKISKLKLIRMR